MKNRLLQIVNPLLLLSMLTQIVSGAGMSEFHMGVMHEVHEINGPVLAVLFLAHLTLNFKWFVSMLSKRK